MESNRLTAIKIRLYEIAKNLLKRGIDIEDIAKDTGLTVKEIEKLKKS